MKKMKKCIALVMAAAMAAATPVTALWNDNRSYDESVCEIFSRYA